MAHETGEFKQESAGLTVVESLGVSAVSATAELIPAQTTVELAPEGDRIVGLPPAWVLETS